MFPRNIAENIMPVKLIVPSSLPGGHGGLRPGGRSLNHPRRRRHFPEQRRVLLPEPLHGLCVPAPGQPRMAGNQLLQLRLVVCTALALRAHLVGVALVVAYMVLILPVARFPVYALGL